MTTFTQLKARLKNFLSGWLLVLGQKKCLVECATLCIKSEVILMTTYIFLVYRWTCLQGKSRKFNWSKALLLESIQALNFNLAIQTSKKDFLFSHIFYQITVFYKYQIRSTTFFMIRLDCNFGSTLFSKYILLIWESERTETQPIDFFGRNRKIGIE